MAYPSSKDKPNKTPSLLEIQDQVNTCKTLPTPWWRGRVLLLLLTPARYAERKHVLISIRPCFMHTRARDHLANHWQGIWRQGNFNIRSASLSRGSILQVLRILYNIKSKVHLWLQLVNLCFCSSRILLKFAKQLAKILPRRFSYFKPL